MAIHWFDAAELGGITELTFPPLDFVGVVPAGTWPWPKRDVSISAFMGAFEPRSSFVVLGPHHDYECANCWHWIVANRPIVLCLKCGESLI